METEEHYSHLLGIQLPWQISDVDLKIQGNHVDIEYVDNVGPCPKCGTISPTDMMIVKNKAGDIWLPCSF